MKKFKLGILVLIMSLFITGCGCSKQTINVSFDTDGGTEIETQTIEKGSVLEEPSEPKREGYTFEGWYLSEEETEEFDFSTELNKDTTLYAKWSMNVSSEVEKTDDEEKEEVGLSVSSSKVELEVGKSTTIKVTTNSDKKASWASSDKSVATVKDGKITAVKAGSATITVTVDGESKTIKVTVVKKAATTKATTAKTTTKKAETTKATTKKTETTKATTKPATTEATTTVNADKTKLSNALATIKAKTVNKAGVSLKYSYDGCTIEMSSSYKNLSIDGVVTRLYRGTSASTITTDYKVTCGKYSDTKTVNHTVPASDFTATASKESMTYVLKVTGTDIKTPYSIVVDDNAVAEYSSQYGGATVQKNFITEGKTYVLSMSGDEDTTYAVKLTKIN